MNQGNPQGPEVGRVCLLHALLINCEKFWRSQNFLWVPATFYKKGHKKKVENTVPVTEIKHTRLHGGKKPNPQPNPFYSVFYF